MGDPRLLRRSDPVREFDTPELRALLVDMLDTMAALDGAGLAAPQIGEPWRVVIFGTDAPNPRYPDAEIVPRTVLINPEFEPVDAQMEQGWEGCLSVPGMRGLVPRYQQLHYRGVDQQGRTIDRHVSGFHARVVQHEVEPSRRHSLSDAHDRPESVRIQRRAVSGAGAAGRLNSRHGCQRHQAVSASIRAPRGD